MCPFAFTDALANTVMLYNLVDSFLVRNLLVFRKASSAETSINSRISGLKIVGFNFGLDESLLSPLVFESTATLWIEGSLSSIQTDLFKSFGELQIVHFALNDLGNFFHEIGIKWMLNLTRGSLVHFRDNIEALNEYTYPDRDFCIFAAFPFQRNITIIMDTMLSECTYTLKWLMHAYNTTYSDLSYDSLVLYDACQRVEFNRPLFDRKVEQCEINKTQEGVYEEHRDYFMIESTLDTALACVIYILIPLGSIVGLVFEFTCCANH